MVMVNRAAATAVAFALAVVVMPQAVAAQATEPASVGDSAVEADPVAAPQAAADEAVKQLTDWVIASRDNNDAPFIVVDKVGARVFVFDSKAVFVDVTPALLGIAHGDDSAPGVGARKLSAIKVDQRTTPAGRFVAKIGKASGNHEVLWVDYTTSISLHPVVTANKKERRLQRLASPTPEDNRITYGCINVPAAFYGNVVRPLFGHEAGVVYILPETKTLAEAFQTFQAQPRAFPEVSR